MTAMFIQSILNQKVELLDMTTQVSYRAKANTCLRVTVAAQGDLQAEQVSSPCQGHLK